MVLVTGATGRIGNVLVKELLKRGEQVRILVRDSSNIKSIEGCQCEIINGDVRNDEIIAKACEGVETVFHLASYINISFYDKDYTYDININGTKNIINKCLLNDINLIYTSSIHAFSTKDKIINENTSFCVDADEKRGHYDCSKAYATKEVLTGMQRGLKAIIIAPTGVTGPYDYRPSFFGGSMIQLVDSGLSSTIDGRYDYVDVRDVVSGMLKAYDLKKYGQIYILSGHPLDMNTYVKYLREFETDKKFKPLKIIKYGAAKFISFILAFFNKKSTLTPYSLDTLNSNCNISHQKATEELGYNPMDLKQSLLDQYNWFKDNGYFKSQKKESVSK